MIIPGRAMDLICHVVVLATGLDQTTGTIYAFVRRASDSFYLKADLTWQAAVPTGADIPTATHMAHGMWKFNLTTAATALLTLGDIITGRMTDNTTPASALVTSDVVEHLVENDVGWRGIGASG